MHSSHTMHRPAVHRLLRRRCLLRYCDQAADSFHAAAFAILERGGIAGFFAIACFDGFTRWTLWPLAIIRILVAGNPLVVGGGDALRQQDKNSKHARHNPKIHSASPVRLMTCMRHLHRLPRCFSLAVNVPGDRVEIMARTWSGAKTRSGSGKMLRRFMQQSALPCMAMRIDVVRAAYPAQRGAMPSQANGDTPNRKRCPISSAI